MVTHAAQLRVSPTARNGPRSGESFQGPTVFSVEFPTVVPFLTPLTGAGGRSQFVVARRKRHPPATWVRCDNRLSKLLCRFGP